MCVCVLCKCVHNQAHICRIQRLAVVSSSVTLSHISLDSVSHWACSSLTWLAYLVRKPHGWSLSSALGLQTGTPRPAFYMAVGELNSNLHTCTASILPTEAPPQPVEAFMLMQSCHSPGSFPDSGALLWMLKIHFTTASRITKRLRYLSVLQEHWDVPVCSDGRNEICRPQSWWENWHPRHVQHQHLRLKMGGVLLFCCSPCLLPLLTTTFCSHSHSWSEHLSKLRKAQPVRGQAITPQSHWLSGLPVWKDSHAVLWSQKNVRLSNRMDDKAPLMLY